VEIIKIYFQCLLSLTLWTPISLTKWLKSGFLLVNRQGHGYVLGRNLLIGRWRSSRLSYWAVLFLNSLSPTFDPVRQSPPSLTSDLESCHNRYGFFFSVNLCFFFWTYALWFCLLWAWCYYIREKNRKKQFPREAFVLNIIANPLLWYVVTVC
jgi:hypothetical protein